MLPGNVALPVHPSRCKAHSRQLPSSGPGPQLGEASLDGLDAAIDRNCARINPEVEQFVTSQTALTETEQANAQREVTLRLSQSAPLYAQTAVPAPRALKFRRGRLGGDCSCEQRATPHVEPLAP